MTVSNDELIKDIYNTKLELDAYRKIADGFLTLSGLPENQGSMSEKYFYEYKKYNGIAIECNRFLNELIKMKTDRGIE